MHSLFSPSQSGRSKLLGRLIRTLLASLALLSLPFAAAMAQAGDAVAETHVTQVLEHVQQVGTQTGYRAIQTTDASLAMSFGKELWLKPANALQGGYRDFYRTALIYGVADGAVPNYFTALDYVETGETAIYSFGVRFATLQL